jgi:hypothetical protein
LNYNISYPIYAFIQNTTTTISAYPYYHIAANGSYFGFSPIMVIFSYSIDMQIITNNIIIFGQLYNALNITIIVNGLPIGVIADIYINMFNDIYPLVSTFVFNASSSENTLTFQVMPYSTLFIYAWNISYIGYNLIPEKYAYEYDNITQPLLIIINYTSPFLNNNLQNQNSQNQNNSINNGINYLSNALNLPPSFISMAGFVIIFFILIGFVAFRSKSEIAVIIFSIMLLALGVIYNIVPLWVIMLLIFGIVAYVLWKSFMHNGGLE